MIRKLLVYLALIFVNILFAQEPITIGNSYKINSSILNEERTIDIQLPKNYSNADFAKGKYPVLYVLDGDFNFQFVAALERFDTKFLYRPHPEMIVVGIRNTDRTRDFTPTNATITGPNGEKRFENSGGADKFIQFLQDELLPFINSKYRTNGYNILLGHSFGGLFTLYTLLEKPALFQGYMAIDPSVWWDGKYVFKAAKEQWKTANFKGKTLFVGLAFESEENAKDRLEHGKTIRKFCETILSESPENHLISNWKYYPEYDHGNIPIPATLDALKFLFDGIQLPVKEVPQNPELVQQTYKALSKKLDFEFIPEESLLYQLIQYTKSTGQSESSKKLLKDALQMYPESKQLQKMNQEL
ncbi:alpha/beta hydrolase-fold protein [Galbibacter sp. PAP.153]|uniref:alpha/beta hydrolase n=1 Tax=Galbibacter sp. PAP.153 TaxID=3104623 RepID=UPI00300BA011